MASIYVQVAVTMAVLTTLISLAFGLPPFEIRSPNTKSEGSEEWLQHLRKHGACQAYTRNHPSFSCTSTRYSDAGEECILEHQLCNGKVDCPHGEDESPMLCALLRMAGFSVNKPEENAISWNS